MPRTSTSDISFLYREGARGILVELDQKGPKRFSELYKSIQFKTTTTLSDRLKELTKLGLIKREIENIPGKEIIIYYGITEAGRKTLEHLREIEKIVSNSKIHTQKTIQVIN